jgi:hypothetical protein
MFCHEDAAQAEELARKYMANYFLTIVKLSARRELLGDYDLNLIANYGGMSQEEAESSVGLFAREVLPELQSW